MKAIVCAVVAALLLNMVTAQPVKLGDKVSVFHMDLALLADYIGCTCAL